LSVLDYGSILDSVKYIYRKDVKSFAVEHGAVEFLDTFSLKLFSNDTGRSEVMAVIVDKRGRSDTARTSVVFFTEDSSDNIVPPLIQKIEISTDDSVKFCFNPIITIFNGDISRVRYYWVFGKGKNSRDRNPCESFDVAGMYKVLLTVQDQTGIVSTESVTVAVPRSDSELPEIKRFKSSPRFGKAPLNVEFEFELFGDQKKIKQVNWLFDDGKTKITTRSIHEDNKYLFPGTYYPKVIVCSSAGCDTATDTIVVNGSDYLQYLPKGNIMAGQKVTFYLDGFKQTEYDYVWYFPDTIIQTSQSNCDYVFKNSGSATIKASAILKKGKWALPKYLGEISCIIGKK
jgi:PKD repeat protein